MMSEDIKRTCDEYSELEEPDFKEKNGMRQFEKNLMT